MAAAFDFRFMRKGRGYYCIPEVDIGIPLCPSMIGTMKQLTYKHFEPIFATDDPAWFASGMTGLG